MPKQCQIAAEKVESKRLKQLQNRDKRNYKKLRKLDLLNQQNQQRKEACNQRHKISRNIIILDQPNFIYVALLCITRPLCLLLIAQMMC